MTDVSPEVDGNQGIRSGPFASVAVDRSTVVSGLRTLYRHVSAAWHLGFLQLTAAYLDSSTYRGRARLARWTRHSFTYRWLTREPDPETVVIDLRETWTVGPFARVIDRLASSGLVRRAGATLATFTETVGRPIRRVPVRLASAGLLGFAATALAVSWSETGPVARLAWLAILAVAVLGLRVDATWQDVVESPVADLVRAVFEPPESQAGGDGGDP